MKHDITHVQSQSHPYLRSLCPPLPVPFLLHPPPSWPHSYCHRQDTLKWSQCFLQERLVRLRNLTEHLLGKRRIMPCHSMLMERARRGWRRRERDRRGWEKESERRTENREERRIERDRVAPDCIPRFLTEDTKPCDLSPKQLHCRNPSRHAHEFTSTHEVLTAWQAMILK